MSDVVIDASAIIAVIAVVTAGYCEGEKDNADQRDKSRQFSP